MNNDLNPNFLSELREKTQPLHTALEQLPLSVALLSPDISVDRYIAYLRAMYPIVREVENVVFPIVAGLLPDLENRRKCRLLVDDLGALHAGVPLMADLPGWELTDSLPFAMGVMYVMEGSTLGGRVISKHVEKTLGLDEHKGAKYFSGYGALTGPLWKSFMERLVSYEISTGSGDEIIAGANRTFAIIHRLIEQGKQDINEY